MQSATVYDIEQVYLLVYNLCKKSMYKCVSRESQVMTVLVLLVAVLAIVFPSPAGCEVYYVRSSSSPDATPCPPEASPCLTLQEYVDNSTEFLPENTSDVEFRFLSGEHSLSQPFEVQGGRNIALRSASDVSVWDGLDVTINCKNSYLYFKGTTNLSVHGMSFYRCGEDCILGCDSNRDVKSALTLDTVVGVSVKDLEFVEFNQAALFAQNVSGLFTVVDMISRAKTSSFSMFLCASSRIFQLKLVSIHSSDAICLQDDYIGMKQGTGNSSVALQNVTIFNSQQGNIVAAILIVFSTPTPFFAVGCHFVYLRLLTSGSVSVVGTVISGHQDGLVCSLQNVPHDQLEADTKCAGEKVESELNTPRIVVSNCAFTGGVGDGDQSRLAVLNLNYPFSYAFVNVTLRNVTFKDITCSTAFNEVCSTVVLANLPYIRLEGAHFTNNSGTPLYLYNSTVHVFGENYFIGNHAFVGGGMAFIDGSFLVLHNGSRMVFKDNHADNVGGAWYVSNDAESLYPFVSFRPVHACFITLHDLPTSEAELTRQNVSVRFINNTAHNGGNVLYGGEIDFCLIGNDVASNLSLIFGFDLLTQDHIFLYEPSNDSSRLSSAPTRMCLCENGVPNCVKLFTTVHGIYAGQTFSVSVVAVGQRFGVANGTVYAHRVHLPNQQPASLERSQQSQLVGQPECTTVRYSVQSKYHKETIALTASKSVVTEIADMRTVESASNYNVRVGVKFSRILLSVPVYVNVSLIDCPAGFTLSDEPHQCICHPTITRNRLTCDIDIGNGTVQRSGNVWARFVTSNQSTAGDGVVVSLHCPNGYCKQESQHINLDRPDAQCSFNRSGVLCGGCPPGLNLALGSNRCLICSSGYIALVIPFAVSGVLLVLFIQLLDLTVAVGTINGLIFYANIVKSYEALFFVPGQTNILTVFISWLNLDLGIETCFFSGLDGYVKTWLQFVFPLYIWLLAGVIVSMSRYTSWLSANNSVPVLATMFLLSYNKLFQTIIVSFSFISLELPDNSMLTTWKLDGNVTFLGTKHIILFLTCLLVFALAWLPYTLLLLFYQCLVPYNHKRGCRWVFKLKPFFDANFGPLKSRHLYWVGALLLARAVLLLVFVVSSNSSDSALISVVTVSVLLAVYSGSVGHPYKNWLLSLWENSFFVNLVLLSVSTYYAKLTASSQAPVVYTSISLALLEFLAVVCYHCYKRALLLYQKHRRRRQGYVEIGPEHVAQTTSVNVTHSEVVLSGSMALREPLIAH